MDVSNLHNPNGIQAILHNDGNTYAANGVKQGFQETKGRYELWEEFEEGMMARLKAWNKKSVLFVYQ